MQEQETAERKFIEQKGQDGVRVFKAWYECGQCGRHVGSQDVYCTACGRLLR